MLVKNHLKLNIRIKLDLGLFIAYLAKFNINQQNQTNENKISFLNRMLYIGIVFHRSLWAGGCQYGRL